MRICSLNILVPSCRSTWTTALQLLDDSLENPTQTSSLPYPAGTTYSAQTGCRTYRPHLMTALLCTSVHTETESM